MENTLKKKTQSGSVSIGLIAIIGGVCLVLSCFAWYSMTYTSLTQQETGIVASYENYKNVHGAFFSKVKSAGISVEKYGDTILKAIDVGMKGRYGPDGSKAAMQWIQEQNLGIDSAMYQKLQVIIEAGFDELAASQKDKIDRIAKFDTTLDTAFTGGIKTGWMGFPKRVTAEMRLTISSAATEDVMRSKQLTPISPFAE